MNDMPCGNTAALNEYMRQQDNEPLYEEKFEESFETLLWKKENETLVNDLIFETEELPDLLLDLLKDTESGDYTGVIETTKKLLVCFKESPNTVEAVNDITDKNYTNEEPEPDLEGYYLG